MSRSAPKRSQTILLAMAVVFGAAQAGAGYLFDHVWPQVRFPFLHQQLEKLDDMPAGPTLVALGSSRFGTCLMEEEMTRLLRDNTGEGNAAFFNAAVPAGDLLSSEHALRRLLERGVRPKIALVELCPEMLNRRNVWMSQHIARQVCWEDVPSYWPEIARAGELERLWQCRLFPLYAHRQRFWTFLGQSAGRLTQRVRPLRQTEQWNKAIGVRPTCTAEERARRGRDGLKHVRDALEDYEPGGLSTQALDRILQTCHDNTIVPILIVVPVSSMHRELYTPAIDRAFIEHLEKTCRAYGCRYVDCRRQIPDEDFYDNHHGTIEGGMRFTTWLMDNVLDPAMGAIDQPSGHATKSHGKPMSAR